MYSDNGSNFIGANNELKELGLFLKAHKSTIMQPLSLDLDIEWHFIPAYSPHQSHLGGWSKLSEAFVSSYSGIIAKSVYLRSFVYFNLSGRMYVKFSSAYRVI